MDNRSVRNNRGTGRTATSARTGGNRKRKQSRAFIIVKGALIILSAMLIVIAIMLLTGQKTAPSESEVMSYVDNGKFFDGISIDGIDVSGLSFEEAKAKLLPGVQEDLQSICVTINHDETSWIFQAADLGASSTLNNVLLEAISLGRGSNFIENLSVQQDIKENGRALSVECTVDENKLRTQLDSIAAEISAEPVEPSAEPDVTSSTPAFIYHEGTLGHVLDVDSLTSEIMNTVKEGKLDSKFSPILKEVAPQLSLDKLKAATAQRSVFTTSFSSRAGRAEGRVRNIEKASDIINGCKIDAGQTLSFNEYVGPRTEKGGWALAPGIVNGSNYEMQAGGGICQVSTTLYNALLCSGPEVEIVDRKKHSWPSSYVDYGLDATVSTDGPDLVFKNNSEYPIYIFAYADKTEYTMTIYIFGEPLEEGVTYMTHGEVIETLKPEETKVIEEPLWPTGYSEVVVASREGYIATAYRDKLVNGEVVSTEELYTDKYRAVQGQKKVGAGAASLPTPSSSS